MLEFQFLLGWWFLMGLITYIIFEIDMRVVYEVREKDFGVNIILAILIMAVWPIGLYFSGRSVHEYCKGVE